MTALSASTVSVVIATHNRCAELRESLRRLGEQTEPPAEILVIDDASTDATAASVRRDYPAVKYIHLAFNRGPCAARNIGLATASGDYVLLVDDDSWFIAPDSLARAVRYADDHPDAAAIAFNIEVRGRTSAVISSAPYDCATFIAAGALLRRSAALAAGSFTEPLWWMGEEEDLAIRLCDLGCRIVALSDILVHHAQSQQGRDWGRIRFYAHRNTVLRELLRCPARRLPYWVVRVWLSQTTYNLRNGYFTTDFRVLLSLPRLLSIAARCRRPVSSPGYARWRGLWNARTGR